MLNENRVHPIKRKKVKSGIAFIESLNTAGLIQKIILFGSAITDDCSEDSDIDLCFVTDATCEDNTYFRMFGGIGIAMDDLCDILVYKDLKGQIKDEIDRKGVVIYEYQ